MKRVWFWASGPPEGRGGGGGGRLPLSFAWRAMPRGPDSPGRGCADPRAAPLAEGGGGSAWRRNRGGAPRAGQRKVSGFWGRNGQKYRQNVVHMKNWSDHQIDPRTPLHQTRPTTRRKRNFLGQTWVVRTGPWSPPLPRQRGYRCASTTRTVRHRAEAQSKNQREKLFSDVS